VCETDGELRSQQKLEESGVLRVYCRKPLPVVGGLSAGTQNCFLLLIFVSGSY